MEVHVTYLIMETICTIVGEEIEITNIRRAHGYNEIYTIHQFPLYDAPVWCGFNSLIWSSCLKKIN